MKGIILFLLAGALFAQNEFRLDISGEWRFRADDRSEYASRDYDDSGWERRTLLGVVAGVANEESVVAGERFTFVSDGVVEAENAHRELFGFDRTREISMKPAQEIAEAATAWGQNDDITVVTVRRVGQ